MKAVQNSQIYFQSGKFDAAIRHTVEREGPETPIYEVTCSGNCVPAWRYLMPLRSNPSIHFERKDPSCVPARAAPTHVDDRAGASMVSATEPSVNKH